MIEAYVARQPIFDKLQRVYAYELLFRKGTSNAYSATDGDQATSSVISDSFLLFGVDALTSGKKAFINFTQNLLMDDTATILPKDLLVVEILETVAPDKGVIAACRKLKLMGYTLALDDFVFEDRFLPLLELADIIKVDFRLSSPDERTGIVKRCSGYPIKFLAEKVEKPEEFEEAINAGYTYFQGYFFSKPVILSSRDIPSSKISFMSILHEVNLPEIDFNKIETIIKRDLSISFKLLKFINSAFFSFSREIHSIKQALLLLGSNEIRKWVSLIILKGMGQDKPEELVVISIIRARLCELIGKSLGMKDNTSDLFFMGLFSMIDTFMNRPMEEVLSALPLADEIKSALLGREGPFNDIYQLVLVYEKVDWEQVTLHCDKIGLDQFIMADHYIKSIEWANNLLSV
jgi:c-di-GMP-related signal transduction protein